MDPLSWLLLVLVILFCFPVMVYLTVKLGTIGYLMAQEWFKEYQKRKQEQERRV